MNQILFQQPMLDHIFKQLGIQKSRKKAKEKENNHSRKHKGEKHGMRKYFLFEENH